MLTIDHINNDGYAHRLQLGDGRHSIYRWLERNKYPEGYRVSCFNCNSGRHINGGQCPHLEEGKIRLSFLQRMITRWADRVFPDRTVESTINKLVKDEIPEFMARPADAGEYSDLVILILDIAGQQGIDIERAVVNKMNVNAKRSWRKLSDGRYQHK